MKQPFVTPTRPVIGLLLAGLFAQSSVAAESRVLVSFESPESLENWVSVNDGVMGGVSAGRFEHTGQETLRFTGTLSLENNGGFASIRMQSGELDLADMAGIAVQARGDGRTYWVDLRTADQPGASSYRAALPTSNGEMTETRLPFSDFTYQRYGREVPSRGAIDPAQIVGVGFTLADKQAGPFELEIDTIRAYADDPDGSSTGSDGTILDLADEAGAFETLLAAVSAAELTDALSEPGPFTLLAPNDEAFSRLPAGTVDSLLQPENRQKLVNILTYHVIPGRVTLARALEAGEGATLQGEKVSASFTGGRVEVGPATLIEADLEASNGIVHVIDQVLMPPAPAVPPLDPNALVELAIDRGVPLFNHGAPGACAAVYEVTCEALRVMPGVSDASREDLGAALAEMRGAATARDQAWILRHALDRFRARHTGD